MTGWRLVAVWILGLLLAVMTLWQAFRTFVDMRNVYIDWRRMRKIREGARPRPRPMPIRH